MTRPTRSPLDGVDRLLVDGNNLLHALRRGPEAAPQAALVGRLRGAIPSDVSIELVFDGPPERGMPSGRLASGVQLRYGGQRSADQLLLALVDDVRSVQADTAGREAAADRVLVVSDDRALRAGLAARGARTARTAWLLARLSRQDLAAPATGNRRPPSGQGSDEQETDGSDGWRPGRGATAKRGNPKRRSRHAGSR